ncbi:MAG: S41 family peptidase [Porticoccaceae bacterium]|nr:S41 family peptidase [Porticoccaceae bacterium]
MLKVFLTLWLALISITGYAEETDLQQAVNDSPQAERLPLQELRLFTQVFEQVRTGYVKDLSDSQLFDSAMQGLLTGLDPHSSYLNQQDYQQLQEYTSGDYGGLGMEVIMDKGLIRVVSPIDNSPAAKAGIQAGDFIVEIDNKPVRGIILQKAIAKLRGKKGSSIRLGILREGETEVLELSVVRDIIHINSVRSRILEEGFGYMRISQFQINSDHEFKAALSELQADGALQGLAIDLRNNPGGLMPMSVEIADTLIDKGLLVYTEGRLPSANQQFNATSGDLLNGAPVVVIINGGSASASEIVAGALQDQGRATILGTQSFGKGSVQTLMPLGDGRAIKLTTARYFTPSGRSIQGEGIVPDIVVEPTDKDTQTSDTDNQLKAAVDQLKKLNAGNQEPLATLGQDI